MGQFIQVKDECQTEYVHFFFDTQRNDAILFSPILRNSISSDIHPLFFQRMNISIKRRTVDFLMKLYAKIIDVV